MIWTVIANTSQCKIYEYDRKTHELQLLKELFHPESRLKDHDLASDKPGHYKSHNTNRGAYTPDTDPHENELEHFAHLVAKEMDNGRTQNEYEGLVLISLPKMLGLIKNTSNPQVQKLIIETINKDNIHFTKDEIINELRLALHRPKE